MPSVGSGTSTSSSDTQSTTRDQRSKHVDARIAIRLEQGPPEPPSRRRRTVGRVSHRLASAPRTESRRPHRSNPTATQSLLQAFKTSISLRSEWASKSELSRHPIAKTGARSGPDRRILSLPTFLSSTAHDISQTTPEYPQPRHQPTTRRSPKPQNIREPARNQILWLEQDCSGPEPPAHPTSPSARIRHRSFRSELAIIS
jgi:hypothetical protein